MPLAFSAILELELCEYRLVADVKVCVEHFHGLCDLLTFVEPIDLVSDE